MTPRSLLESLSERESLNFLLTNRIPRQLVTRFIGWFSKVKQPLVRDASIAVWRFFSKLDLAEAEKSHFSSMHDCFIRELKSGARPIHSDPALLVSPCDAIVGACGRVEDGSVIQAKGFPYALSELLHDAALVERYRNGIFVTLRITASMYHRFHAPYDCRVTRVTYISGDTWNVNPIALKRVEKLFCKNERAPIEITLRPSGHHVTLVAVAAVLVASIRLHFVDTLLHLKYRGPNVIPCDTDLHKGQEMGWFQHGSTIIVFAPQRFELAAGVEEGAAILVGEPLLHLPGR